MSAEPQEPEFISNPEADEAFVAELEATSQSKLPPALAAAQAAGVDLAHLRHNLTLTPAQRLARLRAGIRMIRTLRSARTQSVGNEL